MTLRIKLSLSKLCFVKQYYFFTNAFLKQQEESSWMKVRSTSTEIDMYVST